MRLETIKFLNFMQKLGFTILADERRNEYRIIMDEYHNDMPLWMERDYQKIFESKLARLAFHDK